MSIANAISGTAPISERDIAFWTAGPELPLRYRALHRFFGAIPRRCARGASIISDVLLRKLARVPRRRIARLAARLQPLVGVRLAAAIAAAWAWRKSA